MQTNQDQVSAARKPALFLWNSLYKRQNMSGIGVQLKHCLLLEAVLIPLPGQDLSPMKRHSTLSAHIWQHSTHSASYFVIKHTFNR